MKIITLIIITIVCFCSSCVKTKTIYKDKDYCSTKYPIILVHGLGIRDDSKMLKYWGRIIDHLKANGAVVLLSNQQAFSSHEKNANLIKNKILNFLKINPHYKKINIIAHSKGGIESRYMISMLGMEHIVASLTTIATPHRGSKIADIMMKNIKSDKHSLISLINNLGNIMGDHLPSSYDAGLQLTSDYMRKFNDKVIDKKEVHYQSYACIIDETYPNQIWRLLWKIHFKHDGPNDGLVSVRSAKWGTFKGLILQNNKPLVSHADVIGIHVLTAVSDFNEDLFFIDIVHELKLNGY